MADQAMACVRLEAAHFMAWRFRPTTNVLTGLRQQGPRRRALAIVLRAIPASRCFLP